MRRAHRVGNHGPVTVEPPHRGLVLVVEDEPAIADLVRLYLTRDGFGVHVERDGDGRSDRGPPAAPGGLRPGHRAAGPGRHRDLPPAARGRRLDPGHLPHRPRRRGRPDRRPGVGRRRLRHQAVQPAGAGRPGRAVLRRTAGARTARTGSAYGRPGDARPGPPHGHRRRRRGAAHLHRVRPAGPPACTGPAGSSPGRSCWPGSGATPRTPAPGRSTCTSPRCGRSSARRA